ncbi:putative transferase CAF17 homolog, mitochondrial [Physella acuta]|uniref:putative transferase CAF17 homolog, mitochondrial n=1 Tax=Physella acuta TaxID=109671 RepID=UPI0027DAFDFD|nr:putative transferase CAF17 homolog, mitochondrial [Physella acuta]
MNQSQGWRSTGKLLKQLLNYADCCSLHRCKHRVQPPVHMLKALFHSSHGRKLHAACKLETRGVVRVSGSDSWQFLQGLVTNDVEQLAQQSPGVQYNMMLNSQGRVLYDLFLYNITYKCKTPTLLVDVDSTAKDEIIKILKRYKLRKKVDISDASDSYKVWATWNHHATSPQEVQQDTPTLTFHDPRVPMLGNRIVTEQDNLFSEAEKSTERDYRIHRYKWGVPEGVLDLPPGNCFPLESNLAFMNGVNFQKGCYIGQELTARTFHTGVTRKRLMPIELDQSVTVNPDVTISTKASGKSAGKFRSSEGQFGLGLLRMELIEENLGVTALDGQFIHVKVHLPGWWPTTKTN